MATEVAASKVTATMPTPWERITDEAYKSWLLETPMTADEYSEASLVDRRSLKTQFEQQPQQQNIFIRVFVAFKKILLFLILCYPLLVRPTEGATRTNGSLSIFAGF
jgi:hypothetical protein